MADTKPKDAVFLFHREEDNEPIEITAPDPAAALKKSQLLLPQLGPLRPADQRLFDEYFQQSPDSLSPANAKTMMPGEENHMLRRLLEFGAPAIMGGGKPNALIGGAINAGVGEGMDRLGGDDPNKIRPLGRGDVLSELLASLPGAAEAGGLMTKGPALLQKLAKLMGENPIKTATATGIGSGAATAIDSPDASAPFNAGVGGLMGLLGGGIGRLLQNKMGGAPTEGLRKATEVSDTLAPHLPSDQTRQALQTAGANLEDPAAISMMLGDLGGVPRRVEAEKARVELGKSLPRAQAANDVKNADTKLRRETELSAVRDLLTARKQKDLGGELKALMAQRKKFQSADSPTAQRLDDEIVVARAKLQAGEELIARKSSVSDPSVAAAKGNLTTAEGYRKRLAALSNGAKLTLRKQEIEDYAVDKVAEDVATKTGFDARNMSRQEKAATKWLAQDHPDKLIADLFDEPNKSAEWAQGLSTLLGPKSTEMKAIQSATVGRLFSNAVDNADPIAPGKAISGKLFGDNLKKLNKDALAYLFDNPNAHAVLLQVEKLLSTSENLRSNNSLKLILGGGGGAGVLGAGYLASRNNQDGDDLFSKPVALALGTAGVIKTYQSIPKFVEAMMKPGGMFESTLRRYADKKTPGNLANILTAANLTRASDARRLPTKQEQTPPDGPK